MTRTAYERWTGVRRDPRDPQAAAIENHRYANALRMGQRNDPEPTDHDNTF